MVYNPYVMFHRQFLPYFAVCLKHISKLKLATLVNGLRWKNSEYNINVVDGVIDKRSTCTKSVVFVCEMLNYGIATPCGDIDLR